MFLQMLNYIAHFLRLIRFTDHQYITCVNHDHIVQSDRHDQPPIASTIHKRIMCIRLHDADDAGYRVQGAGCKVTGFRIQDTGCRVDLACALFVFQLGSGQAFHFPFSLLPFHYLLLTINS